MNETGAAARLTLAEYLRILQRHWIVVLLSVLLTTSAAALYCYLATPQFRTETTLYVAVQTTDSTTSQDLSQGGTYARQAVLSYVDIITSTIVLDRVAEDLGLDEDTETLARSIAASSPTNTVLIDVAVTRADPDEAVAIARSIAENFTIVVEDVLERPAGGGPSPVQVTTVREARPDPDPVSPNWTQAILLGLLLGALLGVAAALLRYTTDTRLRTAQDVQRSTDLPILGEIVDDPPQRGHTLVVRSEPRSPRAESFRSLRTNLQFLNVGENRSFVVTSAEPGEGKSNVCCNLALSLADTGASVVLVDADLRRPTIASQMGINRTPGLSSVLAGLADLTDVLQRWEDTTLDVLPAGRVPPNPSELLSSTRMRDVHTQLTSRYEWVIIDVPPVRVVTDATILSGLAGGTIIVVGTRGARRPELVATIEALSAIANRLSGVVLTGVPARDSHHYRYSRYREADARDRR